MSSQPNPNQTAELRQAAAMVREMDLKIEKLNATIKEARESRERAQKCRNSNAERVTKLLSLMDCASSGNNRWEGRVTWLLSELVTQAEEHGRKNP